MAVTFDAVGPSSAGTSGLGSVVNTAFSITWSHTNNGNAILVGVNWDFGTTAKATAVTYGGVALSRVGSQACNNGASNGGIEIWGRIGGLPTGANTVSVTTAVNSIANHICCGSVSFSGAASFGSPVTGFSAVANNVSLSITSAATSMVFAAACFGTGGTFTTTAPGTQRYALSGDGNTGSDNVVGGTWAGGGTQTAKFNNTGTDDWGMAAVEILGDAPPAPALPAFPGSTWKRKYKHRQRPNVVSGDVSVVVPIWIPSATVPRRVLRRAPGFRINSVSPPSPDAIRAPSIKRGPTGIPHFRVDGDAFTPPFTQETAPPNPAITQSVTGRIRRAALLLRRPSTQPEPVPPQVIVSTAPAITQSTTARVRRALGSYRRRAVTGAPLAAQDGLPGATTRRRQTILPVGRRGQASPVALQHHSLTARATGRLRALGRLRAPGKVSTPVPPQVNPPIDQTVFARLRTIGRIQPRTKVNNPVPAQQSATPNPSITATVFGRLRTVGRIQPRAKVSKPVPAQVNPPIDQTVFARLRTIGRIRPPARVTNPTPVQQSATPNPPITATVFGRLRTVGRIQPRGRLSKPVPPQVNPPIGQTVFARLRTVGRIRPPSRVTNPTPAQQSATPNPPITATVFGRLRTVGRVKPRTKVNNPVPAQQSATPNPSITATVFGRLRTVGRVRPPAKSVIPVPPQSPIPNPVFRRLRTTGRTNRIPRVSKPVPPQSNPLYPVRPSVGGLSGLRRLWLKIRRKNAYPVPPQVTTLSGPLTITDSHGGVEADRTSGTVIGGTYGSSSSSTVSKGSSGGFTAEPDFDNVAPTYDSDSDSL